MMDLEDLMSIRNSSKRTLCLLNAASSVYFGALSGGGLAIAIFITLPDMYRDHQDFLLWQRMFAVYIFVMLLMNYLCLKYYSRFSQVKAEIFRFPSAKLGLESSFCHSCGLPKPPRSKHCSLCDVCVLKRDHHCFFAGCCIGFHNQRYFIVFCFFGCVGALYSAMATLGYLKNHYADILSSQFYFFLLPWLIWHWWSELISINIVAMVMFSFFCLMSFLGSLYYFIFQCFLLYRGQTTYEFMKGIQLYRCSLGKNLRSVFGPLWFLHFLIPVPCLRHTDNGIDWNFVHDFKQM